MENNNKITSRQRTIIIHALELHIYETNILDKHGVYPKSQYLKEYLNELLELYKVMMN